MVTKVCIALHCVCAIWWKWTLKDLSRSKLSANGVTTSFVLCGTSVGRSKKGVGPGRSHMFKHFHKRNSTSKKLHLPAQISMTYQSLQMIKKRSQWLQVTQKGLIWILEHSERSELQCVPTTFREISNLKRKQTLTFWYFLLN